jgi:hypothetical protein
MTALQIQTCCYSGQQLLIEPRCAHALALVSVNTFMYVYTHFTTGG